MNVNEFLKKRRQEETTDIQTGTGSRSSSFIQGLANERRQNVSEQFGTSAYGTGNSRQGWPSTSRINQPKQEKAQPEPVKITGKKPGETSRSGQSWKERQERLTGKQTAYQMQKESGVVPGKKQEEEPERPSFSASYQEKEDWFNQKIGQAAKKEEEPKEENPLSMSYWEGRVNSALEQTEQKKETKGGRIQKPSADHYDAEQIRQYKEQEIGDYKKVLDDQNALTEKNYKDYQAAQNAMKEAAMDYQTQPSGKNRLAYVEAQAQFNQALGTLQTSAKRSTELADEVNAMIGSYQNQYDDNTRYAGKDYAGMQAYITELADRLDQTGPEEKNAETGQNLREQYQEEIDRATNYSYSMMDMEQLQAEYDRLNRQREELYKPVGQQYRYQATGADRQAAEDRKAEQEKTGEKMRLVQQAMNQLEMNEARGAYEAYAQRKSLGENFGQYGNGNIDLWNVPSLDNIVVWDERRNAEVVIPTTWRENGRVVHTNDPDEAYAHYEKTGKYFGIFATTDEALTYGDQLKTEKAARSTEKPVYDFAGQNLIGVFEEMVNGRKGYKTAGETTEIALRDQVERNMKHLPQNAKEVMLQFLEDKDYVSAANYYKAYESTMTANYANAQYAELKDWASQNFGTALGGSIGAGVAGAVTPAGAWIDNTFNAINNKLVDVTGEGTYRFSDVNSDMYRGARTAAALQEGVQAYNATTGKWEDALNLASGALTSSVQNVVQFALFGSASLPFMAASAAGQSAYQGLKSGLSEEQAAVTSTVSGLIEYMTEKLPLEHLLDKINTIGEGGVVTVKQIAEMIRKQGMEEASEEVVGNIADNLFDIWYNKDNSEFRQYSAQLQREGMSKAEADMEAFGKFFVGDSIEAAAAAYLSTFLLIGGNVASANMQAAQYGKEMKAGEAFNGTQYTVDEMNTVLLAQQIPGEYEGGRYAAEQLKNQVLEGKQLSNRLLGFAAMTNNQVIKDASKYMNQAFEMGPETQSFKMAAAMVGQYDVGSQLPSKAFVESLKSQIEADKEAAKQQKTKAKSAQTTTGETLSHYQTIFAENGVGIRDAKNRTEVMNKLILGQSVSDAELRKLHMGAKLTKQMLYELTGVEIPEGVVKEKDLMQYYRSARDGFEAKIKAEAQERTAQDEQAAAEQQRAFEAEQMRQMDIADRVVEATKSDVDERLQYFMEHGKLKEAEKGAENGQTGEAVLRGAGGRVDGQSDGGTDAAAAGNAEADTRGTEGQNRSGDAGVPKEVWVKGRGNAVSSRDFGLKNATTLKTAREVLQEDETEPMRKFREDVKAKYGYDVVYTDGDFVQRQDGRDVIVRGLFDQESKRLFVNANYFRLSYDQIGNHEVFHIEVTNGDVDLQAMAEAFNEATGNKEILDSLVNQYMEKLALDDYNSALEEVFADMNGKFNGIRSVNVTAYQDIFEQIKAASPKNGEAASSMQKNSVESFGDGKQYVKADRQVIFGNDMDSWSTQLEDYINGKIRRGQDVTLIGADGDELILTATSAGKLSSPYTSDGRTMSETAYERKANAAAHIDELAQVSTRGKNNVSDAESRHGQMASEGWNYRTAFFMDFDGKYYKTTISVSQGADGKMIYNIGKMQERSIPQISGSSDANTGAQRRDASSGNRVAEFRESVKQKNSEVVDEITESKNFKEWFGDWQNHPERASKVVNADGTPKVVYHGTSEQNGSFTVFDESKAVKRGGLGFKALGKGNYFTATPLTGNERYGSRVIEAYLNIRNPLTVEAGTTFRDTAAEIIGESAHEMSYDELQAEMRERGYDGVIQRNKAGDVNIAVAFDSEQIKSAETVTRNDSGDVIPLSERFNASKGDIRYSIDSDMTEDERYRELRGKTVAVTPEAKYTDEQLASIHTLEQLNAKAKSKAEKVIRPLAESLGILNRSMKTPDVEIDFTFSKNKGLRESMSKQLRYGGTYADFAKALVNLDGILENAVLIEQHKDRYAGTTRANNQLKSVSVLVGVFRDGDSLIPTQIEIKDTSNAGGILYMTVTMTKIEAGVMAGASAQRRTPPYVVPASEIETGVLGSGAQKNWRGRSLIPISSYNLAEIFANVNPADGHFLKYVPDGFLNDAQKAAKQSAIREDANRIQSYRQKNSVDTDLMDVWREQNPGQTTVTQEGLDEAQRTLLDRYRNDTVLKTAYDSVGAAKNANETQTKTSRARTNTFEKLFSEAEKSMDGLKKEDMTYDVIREKESLEGAAARLAQDFDGEVDDLLKRTDWTGEDLDTAMGALSVFREEAQKNGDYSKVVEMAQKIRENATKGGQFVQAFAKYNRTTPEGLLVKAIDEVDKAKNPVQRKNVNPIVQTMIDSYAEQIRDLRAEQKQAVQDAKLAGQMGQGRADAAELRKIRERYENQIKALNEQRDKLLADAVLAGQMSQGRQDAAAMRRITDAYNKRIEEWQKKIDLARAAYDENLLAGQMNQGKADAAEQRRKIQSYEEMLADLQAERDEILNGGLDALRATNKGISDAKANEITKNLTEMADALDAVKEGDVDALIDVIQRQAKIRKTPVSKATLNNLKKQNFEWLWNAASTQYLQIAKDYVKPSMARRVATYQTISHLFNMRTGMRNVVSNLAFSAVEAAANDISQIPDMVLGAITGKRGVGFDQAIFSKANWEGFMEGYSKVQPELALDIETAENGKYGTGRRTNKMTGNLLTRNLSRVERLLGYELNLTDEVTKGSIRAETIRQLQKFVDSGKMTMEEAIQAAEQEMLYRTFQDDTLVGTVLSYLKKLGNLAGFGDSGQKLGGLTVHEFGLGDLLTKYTQVPGALVHRSIEFTPAGYAKAIYALAMAQKNGGIQNMSALQQRNIALAIGRATTGSGLIALFAALTKRGIILNADDEDDPDAKALRAAGGISGTQINVDALGRLIRGESADIQDGDTLLGIEFMQPVNGLMTIGALLNNSDEGQNLAQRWLEAILHGTVQSIDDLSVMNTLRTIQNAIEYSQEDTFIGIGTDVLFELAKSSATGFIPSPVRQFAQGMDAYYRDAYGSKNPLVQGKEQVMNAIPGLRQKLPTKLTNFGEDKTYGGSTVQRWMNAFFTPGSVRTYQADDTVQELLDLYYASGNEKIIPAKSAPYKIQVGNERYEMSAEERREYQTTMGQTAKLWMEQFFDSEDYAGMTTEERAAQVEKIVKSAEDVAKNQVAETMGVDSAKVFDQGITVETTRLGLAGESGVSPSLPDSKSIGDPDRTGYKYELTNEELKQWEDLYNGAYTKEVGDVIQSDAYAKADDAEKADMIRDAKETAKNAAKDEFLEALQSVGIRAELDESSDFYEIRKNVTEGTSIEKTVKRLKSDGASDNSISSAITSTIKDGYLNGDFNEKTANKKLVQYGAAKDENDAYWKIREWEGGEDYKKYDRFYASVENGKKLDDTISYYTSHGVESKTLKSQITSHFKPLYLSASVQERQYMKEYLLDAYEALGVSRNKAAKNIDKWLEE